jgi:O-antigen/teichoic acid export membrane protein
VFGRVIAQIADVGALVILARYLSKSDYGALTYGLAIVVLFKAVAVFELPNTLGRFIPIYREEGRERAALGSVVFGLGIVSALGLFIAIAIAIALLALHVHPSSSSTALEMAAILAFLVPIEALDVLLTSLLAIFAGARAIFVRQAVLGPLLRICLVVSVVTMHATVRGVGFAYIATGAIGIGSYALMFRRALRRGTTLERVRVRELSFPMREIAAFAAPLLASTLVWSLMESSDSLLLGYFGTPSDVATFRAVMPLAILNKGVILTFGLLYTPLVARLYARKAHSDLADAYWRSAAWVTMLTVPIFLLTFSFARSTTTALFGSKYDASIPIMGLLSIGYFFHTALGYNGLTLRIFGKLRYSVAVDLLAAVLNVAVNLALIPRYGPLGAAAGTAGTLVIHNVLKQWGLRRYTGIPLFNGRYARAYASIAVVAAALLGLQILAPSGLWAALAITAAATFVLLWRSKATLDIASTFPELARLRGLGSATSGGAR